MYVVGRTISLDLAVQMHFCHSIHFLPMSQLCFCASFVKFHKLVQEIECRQGLNSSNLPNSSSSVTTHPIHPSTHPSHPTRPSTHPAHPLILQLNNSCNLINSSSSLTTHPSHPSTHQIYPTRPSTHPPYPTHPTQPSTHPVCPTHPTA